MKRVLFLMAVNTIVLFIAILLTYKWIGITWWKSLVLYMLYGWSLNIDNKLWNS